MKKVAFVYIGILSNSSRILKQIELLSQSDIEVDVYVGNENLNIQDYSKFDFNVFEFNIIHGGLFKINSFINPIRFCYYVYKHVKQKKYNLIICQELTTFLAGYFLKKFSRDIKVVFDNNELSVERYSGLKKYIWNFIQKKILSSADYIIHSEVNRMNYFIQKHKLDLKKQKLVCNYPVTNKSIFKTYSNEIRIIYFGVIHPNRLIEELIDSFSQINENISLDIVGPGEDQYIKDIKIKIKPFKNINLLPAVSQSEINDLFSKYIIGIAFYLNSNLNNYYCAPNKVFQYINNNLSVITNNYPGLIDVVKKNNIGVCLEEINSTSILKAIDYILTKKLYKNINENIKNKYSWNSQKKEFLSIIK